MRLVTHTCGITEILQLNQRQNKPELFRLRFCTITVWLRRVTGIHAAVRTSRALGSHPTMIRITENDTVLLPCYVEDQGTVLSAVNFSFFLG